ncbi:hypothetical protein CKM354_001196100 [Cercospora kikuchii]|uniref:Uncharacterized protein n=1 Tax=Cercospora kikuchii TaxID=84275 RepID=A0A9P3FIK3_9PEZI|nr:uncharacterized protein CKM354_001196100 [Cercospora kikuchii]GIZ48918.1 hypothetical protein CKM354_001196100 [Cercospora kikuchii]
MQFKFINPVKGLGNPRKPEPNDFFGRKYLPDFGLQRREAVMPLPGPRMDPRPIIPDIWGTSRFWNDPQFNSPEEKRAALVSPFPGLGEGRQPFNPFPGHGGHTGPILLNGKEKREAIVYHPGFLDLRGSTPWNGLQLAGGPEKRNRNSWAQPYPPTLIGGIGRIPNHGPILLAGNDKRDAFAQGFVSPPVLPPVTKGPRRPSSEKRQEDMEIAVAAEKKREVLFPGYRERVPVPKHGVMLMDCGRYIGHC